MVLVEGVKMLEVWVVEIAAPVARLASVMEVAVTIVVVVVALVVAKLVQQGISLKFMPTSRQINFNLVTFNRNIKIVQINVNGFASRRRQLCSFIENQGDCILLINDTRLREKSRASDLPGYCMIRLDRKYPDSSATAGGVAIAVPQKWVCHRVDFSFKSDTNESLMAVIIAPGGKPIKVGTCYNKPGKYFPSQLLKEFTELTFNGKKVPGIFAGDLNCPHQAFGSRITNEFGKSLLQSINTRNLSFYNDGSPTFYHTKSGEFNVLDLVIAEREMSRSIVSCIVGPTIGSDHLPVVTCLNLVAEKREKRGCNIRVWASYLNENVPKMDISCPEEVENDIKDLEAIFDAAKRKSEFQLRERRGKLPPEVLSLINVRKELLKKRKRASNEQERKDLNQQYNFINHKVQSLLVEYDKQQAEDLATKICESKDSNEMWKLYNNFKKKNVVMADPVSPLVRPDGSMTESEQDKCDEFAKHLQGVHQTLCDPTFDTEFKDKIDKDVSSWKSRSTKGDESIPFLTIEAFKSILSTTKSNSAPGDDQVTYDVLKLCNDNTLKQLCQILNNCLKQNIFPSSWKKAKVIMLQKPGRDTTQPAGYRPISLLSCLGKIYERHIYNYLMAILTKKNYFNKYQAGFTKGRSAQEHLFCLAQDIVSGFKQRKCTVGVFLDAQKAFDSVWINGLKYKLRSINLPAQLENLLFSFLNGRSLLVHENGYVSKEVLLGAGTPQGSCLSPILYLIFVNDLPDNLRNKSVNLSQYADDVSLHATDSSLKAAASNIQDGISSLEAWCRKWQVMLLPLKSKVVVFTRCPRHKAEGPIAISLFGKAIPISNQATFLGVVFDSYLTWEPQTANIVSKAYSRLNLLRIVSGLSRSPNPTLLVKLYKSIILPVFEYCSITIVSAAECHMEKLQVMQNQALRSVLNLPAYVSIADLHDASGIKPVLNHLISFGSARLRALQRSSTLVTETIKRYNQVRHIETNSSPLDAFQWQ